jgi:Ca2+-binding EF-hand superfamily protein
MKKSFLCMLGLAALLAVTPAMAAEDVYPDAPSIPKSLGVYLMGRDIQEAAYVERALDYIRKNGRTKKAFDAKDLARVLKDEDALLRKYTPGPVMAYDTDHDGRVTKDELVRALSQGKPEREAPARKQAQKAIERIDLDRDGAITQHEIRTAAPQKREDNSIVRIQELLTLDPDQDGKLTLAELETLARKAFRTVDLDRDGNVSAAESSAYMKALQAHALSKLPKD